MLSKAMFEASHKHMRLRLTINPPDGTPVYKLTVKPLYYNTATGDFTGLKDDGTSFEMHDSFIDAAEVVA